MLGLGLLRVLRGFALLRRFLPRGSHWKVVNEAVKGQCGLRAEFLLLLLLLLSKKIKIRLGFRVYREKPRDVVLCFAYLIVCSLDKKRDKGWAIGSCIFSKLGNYFPHHMTFDFHPINF